MKSKPKSTTRKKNYKRKNNTRKFRQTAGGVKLDSITYPIGRYVFIKQTGFGDDNKWMPGIVFETHLPTDKGPAQLKIQQLSIKEGKVLKSKKGGPRVLFPDVTKKGPKIINNSNEIRVMTNDEMDKLGILDLLSDPELQVNNAYGYFKKKLEEDMKKTSDESKQAFKKATETLVDVDKKQAAVKKSRQRPAVDAFGRKRPQASAAFLKQMEEQKQNKLSTSSSQDNLQQKDEKKIAIARSSSDGALPTNQKQEIGNENVNNALPLANKISKLIDENKDNQENREKLYKLLDEYYKIMNSPDNQKQLYAFEQRLIPYEKQKQNSWILGAKNPSALDQIEAAEEATNTAVTGDGAREAAEAVTEAVTSLDTRQLIDNMKTIAPDAPKPPVEHRDDDNEVTFRHSDKQRPKTGNNKLSRVISETGPVGSHTTGPVPVPPPGANKTQVAPEPVPSTDDKPGEPAAEAEIVNEGDRPIVENEGDTPMVEPETTSSSKLDKAREQLLRTNELRTKERKDREEAIRKRQAESKKEYEAKLAEMREKHEELMKQAFVKFKERDLEAIKSKPDRPIYWDMVDELQQEDLENEEKLKEKISPISFNQEYTDMELIKKVKELREVNHNLNNLIEFVKDIPLPRPPTTSDDEEEPVLPPPAPTSEEVSPEPNHTNSNDEFEASPDGSVVDDEASSDGSIGFEHEGANQILNQSEQINKIIIDRGTQMTDEELAVAMAEVEKGLTREELEQINKEAEKHRNDYDDIKKMEEELQRDGTAVSSDSDSDDGSQGLGTTEQHMDDDDENIRKEMQLEEEIKEKEEWIKNHKEKLKDQENKLKDLEKVTEKKIEEINNSQDTNEDKDIGKKKVFKDYKELIMTVVVSTTDIAVTELSLARKKLELAELKEEGVDGAKEGLDRAIENEKKNRKTYSIALAERDEAKEEYETAMQQKKERQEREENKENANLGNEDKKSKEIENAEKTKTECDKLKNGIKNEDIQVISDKGADWYKEKIPQYSLLEIKEADKVTDYGIYIDCIGNEFVYYSLKHIYYMEFSDHWRYKHDEPVDYLQLDGVIQKINNDGMYNKIRLMTKEEKIDKRVLYNDNVKMLYEFLEKKDVNDVQELINGNTYTERCNKDSPYTEKFNKLINAVINSDENNLQDNVANTHEYLKKLDPPEDLINNCNHYVTGFDNFFHKNLKNNIERQITKLRDEITKSITEKRTFRSGGLKKKGNVYENEAYYLKDNNKTFLDLHIGKMGRDNITSEVMKFTSRITGSEDKKTNIIGTQDFFKDGNIEVNINTNDDSIKNLYPNTLLLTVENTNFGVNVIDDIIGFIDKINLHGDIKENMKLIANIQTIKDCMTKVLKIYDTRSCKMLTNEANKMDEEQKEIYYKMKVKNVDKKGTLIKFVEEEKTRYGIFLNCDNNSSEASIVYIDTENFINPKKAFTQKKPPGGPTRPPGGPTKPQEPSEDGEAPGIRGENFGRKFKASEEIKYKAVKITDIELIKKEDFDISMLFKQYLNYHALEKEFKNLKENYNQNAINEYAKKVEKVLDRNMNFIELTEEQEKIMSDLKYEEKLNSLGLMPENYGKPKDMDMNNYITQLQNLKGTDYHDYILNKAEPSIYMYYNNMLVLIANYNKNPADDDKILANIRKYSERLRKPHFIKIKIDIPGRLIDAIEAIKEVNNIDYDDKEVKEVFTHADSFADDTYKGLVQKLAKILNPGEDKIPFSPFMLPLKPGSSGSIQVSKPPPETANNKGVKGFNQGSATGVNATNLAASTGAFSSGDCVGCPIMGGEKKNG